MPLNSHLSHSRTPFATTAGLIKWSALCVYRRRNCRLAAAPWWPQRLLLIARHALLTARQENRNHSECGRMLALGAMRRPPRVATCTIWLDVDFQRVEKFAVRRVCIWKQCDQMRRTNVHSTYGIGQLRHVTSHTEYHVPCGSAGIVRLCSFAYRLKDNLWNNFSTSAVPRRFLTSHPSLCIVAVEALRHLGSSSVF
jgi:hypothetical protein